MPGHRRNRGRAGLALGSLLITGAGTACASDCGAITVGMTKSQVRARMGPPERIGVLQGKDIERVAPEAEARATGRLVYFYRDGVTVWFENAKVTGANCRAEKPGNATDPAEDH